MMTTTTTKGDAKKRREQYLPNSPTVHTMAVVV
jgi:hypothetical protein